MNPEASACVGCSPLLVVCLVVTSCSNHEPNPSDPNVIQATGVVQHQDIEGGFFGLVADDGAKYDPGTLPEAFPEGRPPREVHRPEDHCHDDAHVGHDGRDREDRGRSLVLRVKPGLSIPLPEIAFSADTSGGKGGQHANRSSTRVELRFDVLHSPSLTPGNGR
jgi:hypothetical protein